MIFPNALLFHKPLPWMTMAIALFLFSLAGCTTAKSTADDTGDTASASQDTSCVVLTYRCELDVLQQCDGTLWVNSQNCAAIGKACVTLNGIPQCAANTTMDSETASDSAMGVDTASELDTASAVDTATVVDTATAADTETQQDTSIVDTATAVDTATGVDTATVADTATAVDTATQQDTSIVDTATTADSDTNVPVETICNDAIDNDSDGVTDCEDPDCGNVIGCMDEVCGNAVDDDGDGDVDCADMDCLVQNACFNESEIAGIREDVLTNGSVTETWAVSTGYVTGIKPGIGNDPAGFFVQGAFAGPAVFVLYADEDTLPEVGDVVSFDVVSAELYYGKVEISEIANLVTLAAGMNLDNFVQDISNVDSALLLTDYDSELVVVSGAFAEEFSSAGVGFQGARIVTTGSAGGGVDVMIRLTNELAQEIRDSYGTVSDCEVTVETPAPLWIYNATAEVPVEALADIVIFNCPGPGLLSAAAGNDTTVVLQFDRMIAETSIMQPETRFSITPSLAVSDAYVMGDRVIITTATQTALVEYSVTVNEGVTGVDGSAVDAGLDTATFTGYSLLDEVVINELDYRIDGLEDQDFIELFNVSGSAIDLTNWSIELVNGANGLIYNTISLGLLTDPVIPSGGSLVIAPDTVVSQGFDDGSAIGDTHVLLLSNTDNLLQSGPDGVRLLNNAVVVDEVVYAGAMDGMDNVSGFAPIDAELGSVGRCPDGLDTNNATFDFYFTETITPGAANNCF